VRIPLLVISVILLGWLWAWATAPLRGGLVLECPEVGAGQCWILLSPAGSAVVVDCGSLDASARPAAAALRALARRGVNRLDAVVLTRTGPDVDSGVSELLREIPCGAMIGAAGAGVPTGPARRELRPGAMVRVREGLTLEAYGAGEQVECLAVRWRRARVALVDRLSPGCRRFLESFDPHVLALGHAASRTRVELPAGIAPAVAVLSSGRARAEWADYGLRRALQAVAGRVCITGRDGGVSILIRGDRVEVRTAR
jgi:beta-lactamase superfamily II metal-dependent hydrolase